MREAGLSGFSLFQLAIVSLPAALVGIFYLSTVGYRILPHRKSSDEAFSESAREYLSECLVPARSPLINKTVEEAGLRNLNGLYMIEVIRAGERIAPVGAHQKLKASDRLIFTGPVSTIVELHNLKGIEVETGTELALHDLINGNAVLLEAVISH